MTADELYGHILYRRLIARMHHILLTHDRAAIHAPPCETSMLSAASTHACHLLRSRVGPCVARYATRNRVETPSFLVTSPWLIRSCTTTRRCSNLAVTNKLADTNMPRAKKQDSKRKSAASESGDPRADENDTAARTGKRAKKAPVNDTDDGVNSKDTGAGSEPEKRAKLPKKRSEGKPGPARDDMPRQQSYGSRLFTCISWNVDGIRAKGRTEKLREIAEQHKPDLICVQETKLQEKHEKDWTDLLSDLSYDAFFSSSTAKAGYAGTAVYMRSKGARKAPQVDKPKKGIASFFTKASNPAPDTAKEEEDQQSRDDNNVYAVQKITTGITGKYFDKEGRSIVSLLPC